MNLLTIAALILALIVLAGCKTTMKPVVIAPKSSANVSRVMVVPTTTATFRILATCFTNQQFSVLIQDDKPLVLEPHSEMKFKWDGTNWQPTATFTLQRSSDLKQWFNVKQEQICNDTFELTDSTATNPFAFYRVKQ